MKQGRASRVAVLWLDNLPLQVLSKSHPHWAGHPVAVVNDEGPHAPLTHVNSKARELRLRKGVRHSAARALVPQLHTAVVSQEHLREVCLETALALQMFSPRVEAHESTTGAFTLDPNGLHQIFKSYETWAECVVRYLHKRGWYAVLVVGFHRERALAVAADLARGSQRSPYVVKVLPDAKDEAARCNEVLLQNLELPGSAYTHLDTLGVVTLGDFLGLPSGEIRSRFGVELARLRDSFDDSFQLPIQPHIDIAPLAVSFQIDPPDSNSDRLLFSIKGALHTLLHQTQSRDETLQSLRLTFHLNRCEPVHVDIFPAKPTLDSVQLIELVRLKLEQISLASEVSEVDLVAATCPAVLRQQMLHTERSSCDTEAADRALARIRTAFGPNSVNRAELRHAHLPEASFRWLAVEHVQLPRPNTERDLPRKDLPNSSPVPSTRMVRRVWSRPRPLVRAQPSGSPPTIPNDAIEHLYGPYRVSGGWWKRLVERDYYYAQTQRGELLWLYFDNPRKRWFLHGIVD